MEKKVKYLIALAGLFHDIGKFYQRATNQKTSEEEKKEFGRAHAALSAKVIDEEINEGLKSVFTNEEIKTIREGVYHHNPSNPIQFLMQKADWVSSSEREKAEAEYSLDIEEFKEKVKNLSESHPRLRSVFEKLNLSEKPKKKGYVYKIAKLDLNEVIFPLDLEQDIFYETETSGEKIEKLLGSYKNQWNSFKNEFNSKLKDCSLKFSKHPEKVFSLIYHILYKYLWCIPASTYDQENYSKHYPDISLFDHSRVLSAVACCFYDYNKDAFQQKTINQFREELKDKKVFLHLKADISGIQKFIYNVYEGKGGVAKTLRGRSFYVSMLWEVLSRHIINELEYPISNILYSGGGIFEILVANTQENRKKLKEIEREINEFLAEKFESDLGLALGVYEYSPTEMMENYKLVLQNLNENLDNAKKQKLKTLIESGEIIEALNFNSSQIENKNKCPVCQTYLIEEGKDRCQLCEDFKNIGEKLPRTKMLAFAKERTESFKNDEKVIDFESFGIVYLIEGEDKNRLKEIFSDEETAEILAINNTDFGKYTTGFKFLGKSVPVLTEDVEVLEGKDKEEFKKGSIAPFTYLAQLSDGDKRIGIIRMDVDNLGKLFSKGLEKISISRVATLSRSLDLFFAGYLNKICENLSNNYKKQPQDTKVKNFFYILYSGGDDLFIVAPWDKAVDIALEIHNEFSRYVCYNPDVTISAGYIQTKPKFPIRVSADIAGEAEEVAKDSGRDRTCILGDVLKWNELEKAKEISENWKTLIEEDKLQRGFIYAVHRLKEQFLKKQDSKDKLVFPYTQKENPMFYPYAQYYIARNIKDDQLKKEIADFLLKKDNFKNLTFVVNYVALKTRK